MIDPAACKQYRTSLKETSYSEAHKDYMTDLRKQVVQVDAMVNSGVIKNWFGLRQDPKACDALLYGNQTYYFIEFKNGNLNSEKGSDIRNKAWNSLTLFCKIYNQTIESARKKSCFILVYNEDNRKESESIRRKKFLSADSDPFNLKFFLEGLYFKKVQTLSKQEFETQFARNTR
jgi:hypothetical protein